jgi:hypothetical protein
MDIRLVRITVRDLFSGYKDSGNDGVVAYNGRLNVRPPYQREFIYKDKQRDAVIDTVFKGLPLNVLYWSVGDDDSFEVIDGQQRSISICQYVNGDFSVTSNDVPAKRSFNNLQKDEREKILNYELMVYECTGTTSEKLAWFETINIAGESLTAQELKNAVFSGPWVTNARAKFSRKGCIAYQLGKDYLKGSCIRQEYLETAIKWISDGDIESHMSANQHKTTANELLAYFRRVIAWVKATFPTYRNEMQGIAWGLLYNKFKDQKFNAKKLETKVSGLMADEDVTNKKGIYSYVLDGKEKHLSVRAFTAKQKREAYDRQKGFCPDCKTHFEIDGMEGDHITPWSKGGKTTSENCQMLCVSDNRTKGSK